MDTQRAFDVLSELNKVKKFSELKRVKIYNLEKQRKYKITFAKIIRAKFGNSVLLGLDDSISTFLPKKYSEVIKPRMLEDLIGKILILENIEDLEDGKQTVNLSFTTHKNSECIN